MTAEEQGGPAPTDVTSSRLPITILMPGLGTGGAERSLLEVLPGLVARGVQPTVICLHRRPQGVHHSIEQLGVPVISLGDSGMASRVRDMRRHLQVQRPAVLHTTMFEANVVGRLAAANLPVHLLTSLVRWPYDPALYQPGLPRARARVAQAVEAFTGRLRTDHYHAISDAVRHDAIKGLRIPPDRLTVIPRGRDAARLGEPSADRKQIARIRLGIDPQRPLVVNVGRQEHQKGQRHLLVAANRLRTTFPELLVITVGREGHASVELNRLVERYDLEDSVRFVGHRDDVPEFLAAADIFAFPSLSEGLGGAVIEAMALGVPTVASDIAALREVTGGGAALLVPPGDPGALADGLAALLTDSKRARSLGEAGRRRYLEHYTVDRMVDRTWDLYQRLAAGELTAAP